MSRRMGRVNGLLREELSQLILREMRDPRVGYFVTITEVDTAPDLDSARVYVSVMAPVEEQADVMKGLKAAEGFLKASLRSRLQMRKIPTLSFELDASMEQGANLVKLIDQVIESDTAHEERSV